MQVIGLFDVLFAFLLAKDFLRKTRVTQLLSHYTFLFIYSFFEKMTWE